MTDDLIQPTSLSLQARIEALLFVASGSLTPNQLAGILEVPTTSIEQGLKTLAAHYNSQGDPSGIQLQELHGRYQLTTLPQAAPDVEKLLGLDTSSRLSRAALETLAVVAYQEPVTRPQIDAVRGVNSDGVLKNLLNKGLIQEIGRAEAPGRPILYSVTSDFLRYFGLKSLEELPPLTQE